MRGPGGGHGPMRGMMPGEKAKDFKGTLLRLITYIRPFLLLIGMVMCLTIVSTILQANSPKVMGQATDAIVTSLKQFGRVDFIALQNILTVLASLYLGTACLNYAQQFLMSGLSQRIVRNLRADVDAKLMRLPLKYYDGRTHGEILSRVVNDVDTISSSLQQSLNQIIHSVVSIVSIMYMMLSISPQMTMVTLLTIPLSLIITTQVTKRSQPLFVAQQRTLGQLNGLVEEMLTGHVVVKAFGRERDNIERFAEINEELYTNGWRAQFMSGIIMPLINLVGNLGYVIICIFGGIMTTQGTMTIGKIQSFLQYSRQFNQPLTQTAQIANIMQSTVAAAERVFELLNEPEQEEDAKEAITLSDPKGAVSFRDVHFGYSETPVIKKLSFDITPGQMVAIVGPTGAGKTTLVNLLMRFYEIQEGTISIDGTDIRDLKRSELRSMFGMVLQDTWLYNDTIASNLAYGKLDATHEEIVRAARAARADHFIRTLPEGYNTVLNEEATNLSQGQRQLLTIARALLSDPTILILDEATSSVDTRTEQQIQEAMATLMKGRTSFVIAHRLSTIRNADLILVINEGDIIEQGSHQELLNKRGFYADLYNSQFTTAGGTIDEAMGRERHQSIAVNEDENT
ncbi:MAG: ABC transporter ATP-binding protein/permease [Symbiobacteriaceae bacterium]|nr:ABC transporter ATP-binding protein/permease [Symbiobacteriaceae bacterium]